MAEPVYCTGTFIGQRVFDESINVNQQEGNQIKLTLCFTPTKDYPSVFGAGYYESSSISIIRGTYDGTTRKAAMMEIINGTPTFEYKCKLSNNKSNGTSYLHGTCKSMTHANIFGQLVMICETDITSDLRSGLWIGEATPDIELADFFIPINPIRWCATLFRINNDTWKLFGSGYFNDSADIPNQPLLFFTLDGNGTLDHMNIIKKYTTTDYIVEYAGKLIQTENESYKFQGRWSNSLAGSYGSFEARQCQFDPLKTYRLDICICEVCRNAIHPGENRWCCFPCHFSTCSSCNLNSIVVNHPHKFILDILPNQNMANGQTCLELLKDAFQVFNQSPFLLYRNFETNEFISMNYNQMFIKCQTLGKYWKQFIPNVNDTNRPMILFIADTSPVYICCLLTGLLLQSVLVPINGLLAVDPMKHILTTTNPSIIVIGEHYLEKVLPMLSSDQKKVSLIIHQNEEQFQTITTNNTDDIISFTKALKLGEESNMNIDPSCSLSNKTMSAILSTSGSTGYPKGAIFTEELLVPTDSFTLISPFVRIDYQPFDPVLVLSLMSTMRYGSCRGLTNLNHMWDDIKYIRPTSLGLTPSLWNIIYKNYLSKLNRNLTRIQKETIEKQMRDDLGGRLIVGTSGGGSISPNVLAFVRNRLKIDLVDMYGCRECGNISKNGIIYPGIDVKLISVKDVSEFDGIKQGEICIHSPKMISGYWGIENHHSFIQIEGKTYYKTGDIGQLEGKTIKLLDRSGTMIKNSMGEWISPVKVENILEQLSEISASFVMGHSNYSYLIAIICPSQSGSTLNELDMLQLIRFHSIHCGLIGPEIPQAIYIERDMTWNQQNGFFKEKKSRHALFNHYSSIKTQIYNQEFIHSINNTTELKKDFMEILEKVLTRSLTGQINGENTFVEIGGDSLGINLLCQIYHEKGIYLSTSTVYNHSLNHLQQLLTNENLVYDHICEDINWNDQSKLPQHFLNLISQREKRSSEKKNIFFTGSTGFLGPILLSEILAKTDGNTRIYCLIRATDDEHARQRLEEDLNKCQRKNSIDWKRISCLAGNIAKEHLGLNLDFYNQLIEEIGLVYHNASYVHLDMPYKALKKANVQGTLNALEFALKSNSKFVYISSIAALPAGEQLQEDSNGWVKLTSHEINDKDGYGQTKVVVEQILRHVSDLGPEIVIIRPCAISADRLTGYTNLNDFINILLTTQLQLNTIVENSNMNLHFVPVDYCAEAIVALANHPDSTGKCFNFYGNPLNISAIYEIVFDRFPHRNIQKIKQNEWKEFLLENLSEKNRAWILKDRLSSMIFNHHQEELEGVPIHMTKKFLEEKCHLPWFHVKKEDFIKSIDYMIEQEFLS